ncbi:arginine--tRNA ligase, putative [Hepatocystis sp. ex Piliocolobus tephrosceles]|nr:arginine--tRNA ligase, putative [Hepatocystis sp. ex Piliocolobus tephrosceles]
MVKIIFMIIFYYFHLKSFTLHKSTHSHHEHINSCVFFDNKVKIAYINISLKNKKILKKQKQINKNQGMFSTQLKLYDNTENENIYILLNNELNNIFKKIVKNENVNIPPHCLIENNKIHESYECQSSLIPFLVNYTKQNINNIKNDVVNHLNQYCSQFIKSLLISHNGVLNIKIKQDYIIKRFLLFYELNVLNKKNSKIKEIKKIKNVEQECTKDVTKVTPQKQIILLDYCGVNMGKHMHLGHLKSLFLGYSLSNFFRYNNYIVKNRSHIGDWNLNIATIITFFILFPIHENTNVLNKFYPHSYINKNKIYKKREEHTNTNDSEKQDVGNSSINTYTNQVTCNINSDALKKDNNQQYEEIVNFYLDLLKKINEDNFNNKYRNFLMSKYEQNINVDTIDYVYKISKQLYSLSDVFQKCCKISLSLMYERSQQIMNIWNSICSKTKKENEEIFKTFGIKKLIEKGEHFYVKYVPTILKKMKVANILFEFKDKLFVLLKEKNIMCEQNKNSCKNNSNSNYGSSNYGSSNNGSNSNCGSNSNYGSSNYDSSNYGSNSNCGGNIKYHIKMRENVLRSFDEFYDVVHVNDENYKNITKKDNNIDVLKDKFIILTLKNNISYTYAAIDIAAIYYRVKYEKANKIIYVVDENQKKHFKQVFSISKYLHIIPDKVECICINYGFVLNEKNKKIKTKNFSNNIFAKDIIKQYKTETKFIAKKKEYINIIKNYNPKHYEKLLFSSMIYSYICVKNWKRQFINNIIKKFHLEYIYILNIYNEISLYLLKLKKFEDNLFILGKEKMNKINIENDIKKIVIHIIQFKYIVQLVTRTYNIEMLCSYLYTLSQMLHDLLNKSYIKQNTFPLEKNCIYKLLNMFKNQKQINQTTSIPNVIKHTKSNIKSKKYTNIDTTTNYHLFLEYIKNGAFLDANNMHKIYTEKEVEKIEQFFLNRFLEVLILKAYLCITDKVFNILNLTTVKFN